MGEIKSLVLVISGDDVSVTLVVVTNKRSIDLRLQTEIKGQEMPTLLRLDDSIGKRFSEERSMVPWDPSTLPHMGILGVRGLLSLDVAPRHKLSCTGGADCSSKPELVQFVF
ncbi:hypothetical protein INR49_025173 [Caranx melampygus]|nr:hypothetical protein INR49_025173 [Caranx melampygus]